MGITVTRRGQELWTSISNNMGQRLNKVLDQTALNIEHGAQGRAPVDTSALRNSIHAVTPLRNEYEEAATVAEAVNPDAPIFTYIGPHAPLEAIVAVCVGYGEPVEYGTTRRPATPFFTPAVEAERGPFLMAVADAISKP